MYSKLLSSHKYIYIYIYCWPVGNTAVHQMCVCVCGYVRVAVCVCGTSASSSLPQEVYLLISSCSHTSSERLSTLPANQVKRINITSQLTGRYETPSWKGRRREVWDEKAKSKGALYGDNRCKRMECSWCIRKKKNTKHSGMSALTQTCKWRTAGCVFFCSLCC